MFRAAAALLLAAFAQAATSGRLSLEAAGLSEGARAYAFTGLEEPVEAARRDGAFIWPELAPGTYNIELIAADRDIIGIDLSLRDVGGGLVETRPLGQADEAAIRDIFAHSEDFFDARRMPLVAGAPPRAVALVENVRDGSSTTMREAAGKVFFRLDLWEFEKSYGSWRKVKSRAFLRRTMDKEEFHRRALVYDASLGGINLAPGENRSVKYDAAPADAGVKEEK